MATTRQDVILPKGIWTDLYAASGIPVGTSVSVYNKGSQPIYMAIANQAPTSVTFGVPVYTGADGFMMIQSNEIGLWACCEYGGKVLVQES